MASAVDFLNQLTEQMNLLHPTILERLASSEFCEAMQPFTSVLAPPTDSQEESGKFRASVFRDEEH